MFTESLVPQPEVTVMTSNGSAAAARIAAADPAGLLYGAIISASVLATVSAHSDQITYVALAAASVLGVYWLAHVYIAAQTRQLKVSLRVATLRLLQGSRQSHHIV